MYNPFPLLNPALLRDKISKGKRYFVRQTYKRGYERRLKAAFLIRAYDETEKEIAEQHYALLEKDGNKFLYDATNAEDLQKLHIAASQPFGYKVYYAGKKGVDWKPPAEYQKKIRQYIRQQHPGWQSPGEQIEVGLFEEFGNLFLKLSYKSEEDLILLEDIEKL